MKRSLLLYPFLIGSFICLIWLVIDAGKDLVPQNQSGPLTEQSDMNSSGGNSLLLRSEPGIWAHFFGHMKSPLGLFLLQLITILFFSKLFGTLFSLIRQPFVVGEMIAGILLGPSVMGYFLPEFSEFMFPKNSLTNLQFLSQIGLAFFMFIIGMELDFGKLRNQAHHALVISHASIVFPYFLGVAVSYYLYEKFALPNVSFLVFSLFMGIAISITAFPVLARILHERKLTKSSLGAIVLACAAFDDVTAWCILATVIAIAKAGSLGAAIWTIFLTIIFVFLMFVVLGPILKKVFQKQNEIKYLSKPLVVVVFFTLLLSAWITETIGVHALFGAFLAGVVMPQKVNVKELLMEKMEDISVLLLLPIFFAYTGLRTEIGLLRDGHLWATCGLIIFVAVLGKFGGSAFAAKLTGQSWKTALSVGALMNTRGLMELIVLNIGYDLGILSPALFAIMVLMALATTFMTGPLLDLINYFSARRVQAKNL